MNVYSNDMISGAPPVEDLATASLSKTELLQSEAGASSSIKQQPIKPSTQSTGDVGLVVYDSESLLSPKQDLGTWLQDWNPVAPENEGLGLESASFAKQLDIYSPEYKHPSALLKHVYSEVSISSLQTGRCSSPSDFSDQPDSPQQEISNLEIFVPSAKEDRNGESSALQVLDTKRGNTLSIAQLDPTEQDMNHSEKFQLTSMDNQYLKSEAESSCLEEESDWDDITSESSLRFGVLNTLENISTPCSDEHLLALVKPVLSPAKQEVVNNIMKEFWIHFDQNWAGQIRSCTGSITTSESGESPSSDSSLPGKMESDPKNQKNQNSSKRSRDDEPDDDPDDGEQREPKRSKKSSTDFNRSSVKFACPYRKNNPRKYCVQSNWRPCALTPLETVARVKGHLYRHHRIFQCQRCKILFNSSEEVDKHLKTVKGCELSLAEEAEGITTNIEKRLRSRKKTSKDQTEEQRWEEIYRLIFPGNLVPSPYFEPIHEDGDLPRDTELFLYEEYSRRELPRMFRGAIEAIVNEKTQPLENQLRGQLTTIIQQCQDKIFSNYLRQKCASSPLVATLEAQAISQTDFELLGHGEKVINDFSQFYQRPPLQIDVEGISFLATSSSDHSCNGSADSGYTSDISALLSSQNSYKAANDHTSMTSSDITTSESVLELPSFPDNNDLEKDLPEEVEERSDAFNSSDLLGIAFLDGNIHLGIDWGENGNVEKAFDGFLSADNCS